MMIATNANTYPLFDELLNALDSKDIAQIQAVSAEIRRVHFIDSYEFRFCLAHYMPARQFANNMARLNFLAWCGVAYQWDNVPYGVITYFSTCKKDGTVFAIATTTRAAQVKEIAVWDKAQFRREWEKNI